MMKKILLASLALPLLASSAIAGDCSPKAHGGLAVGLHGGYVTAENRVTNSFHRVLTVSTDSESSGANDVSARGGVIGIDFSYGHIFSNRLYAGLELKADLGSVKGNNSYKYASTTAVDYYQKVDLKAKESYGAALKLGGLVDKALPYITVGVVSTKFEATRSSQPSFGTLLPVVDSQKNSKRLTGFELGAGVDLPVSDHITVGARYLHTEYGKMTSNFNATNGRLFQRVELKPRTNAFLLNVKYRVW